MEAGGTLFFSRHLSHELENIKLINVLTKTCNKLNISFSESTNCDKTKQINVCDYFVCDCTHLESKIDFCNSNVIEEYRLAKGILPSERIIMVATSKFKKSKFIKVDLPDDFENIKPIYFNMSFSEKLSVNKLTKIIKNIGGTREYFFSKQLRQLLEKNSEYTRNRIQTNCHFINIESAEKFLSKQCNDVDFYLVSVKLSEEFETLSSEYSSLILITKVVNTIGHNTINIKMSRKSYIRQDQISI